MISTVAGGCFCTDLGFKITRPTDLRLSCVDELSIRREPSGPGADRVVPPQPHTSECDLLLSIILHQLIPKDPRCNQCRKAADQPSPPHLFSHVRQSPSRPSRCAKHNQLRTCRNFLCYRHFDLAEGGPLRRHPAHARSRSIRGCSQGTMPL